MALIPNVTVIRLVHSCGTEERKGGSLGLIVKSAEMFPLHKAVDGLDCCLCCYCGRSSKEGRKALNKNILAHPPILSSVTRKRKNVAAHRGFFFALLLVSKYANIKVPNEVRVR